MSRTFVFFAIALASVAAEPKPLSCYVCQGKLDHGKPVSGGDCFNSEKLDKTMLKPCPTEPLPDKSMSYACVKSVIESDYEKTISRSCDIVRATSSCSEKTEESAGSSMQSGENAKSYATKKTITKCDCHDDGCNAAVGMGASAFSIVIMGTISKMLM